MQVVRTRSCVLSGPTAASARCSIAQVKLGVVILTMGDRRADLTRLLDSVLAQSGAPMRIVVVGNGARLSGPPGAVEALELPENRGVRAGRNAGLAALHAHGDIDVVMYLDDDGTLPDTHAAEHVCDLFATTPTSASSASASPSGPQSPSRAGPRPLGCVPGPAASSKAGAPRAARAAPSTGVLSGG